MKQFVAICLLITILMTICACTKQEADYQTDMGQSPTQHPSNSENRTDELDSSAHPQKGNYEITASAYYQDSFSEGVMWALAHDETGAICTVLVDKTGRILTQFSDIVHMSDMKNGESYEEVDANAEVMRVVNQSGEVRDVNIPAYDRLLLVTNGHFVMYNEVSDFSSVRHMLQIVDFEGNIISEYQIDSDVYVSFDPMDLNVTDCGDGIILFSQHFIYSFSKNCWYDIAGEFPIINAINPFYIQAEGGGGDFAVVSWHNNVKTTENTMRFYEDGEYWRSIDLSRTSFSYFEISNIYENKIVSAGDGQNQLCLSVCNMNLNEDDFGHDIVAEKDSLLGKILQQWICGIYYSEDTAVIEFIGADKVLYIAAVDCSDTEGRVIIEPTSPTDGMELQEMCSEERIVIDNDVYDYRGNIVFQAGDIDAEWISGYSDGVATIGYTKMTGANRAWVDMDGNVLFKETEIYAAG